MAQQQWNYVPASRRCWYVLALWLAAGLVRAFGADEYFPTLTIGGNSFSNVTIISRSATHVSFKHSGGFASVKVSALPAADQTKVGYTPPPAPKTNVETAEDYIKPYLKWLEDPRLQKLIEEAQAEVNRIITENDKVIIYPAVGGVACIYFLFCLAVVKICKKTTVRPGLSAWVPGFQFISLFKAAGMSPWSYLLLYIPPVNLIVMIMWCFKICRTRQKSSALGFLLLIPVMNILAFFYLAFSSHKSASTGRGTPGKLKLSFQPR